MTEELPVRQGSRGGRKHVLTMILALAATAATAACSSTPGPSASTSTTEAGSASTSASTTSPTPAPVYEVTTGNVSGLGTVLVNGQGLTLYLFVPDQQKGQSTCYAECAVGWPPLLLPSGVTTPLAGPGVNQSLLGTTTRTDGSVEVTYNHWPLYTWTGDSEPGQATGQGINSLGGLWYVLSPSGAEITKKPS